MIAYRVQDAAGRGPWRPGFSQRWIDADAPEGRLSETVMDLISVDAMRALPATHHYAVACRTLADLGAWFTPTERRRLAAFGFWPVQVRADVVIAESRWQMLIGRVRPFAEGATRRSWSALVEG